jgi:hypothetical protein
MFSAALRKPVSRNRDSRFGCMGGTTFEPRECARCRINYQDI